MRPQTIDYREHVLDEIALEGLDGITLQGLWERLLRRPSFAEKGTIDDYLKEFLWKKIKVMPDIDMYELEEPRPNLVVFDRYDHIDPELCTTVEQPEVEDIYPPCPITSENPCLKGSCSTYYSRKSISFAICEMSLLEATDMYGNKLVLVASQKARRKALGLGHLNPANDLSLVQYVILERIARSRYLGELTHGKNSLRNLGYPPKSLFYFTKRLLSLQLITKQQHRQKSLQGKFNVASLYNLTRLYVERKSKFVQWIEKSFEILRNSPNYTCTNMHLRQELEASGKSIKRLFKTPEFLKYIAACDVPFRAVYPNATEMEYMNKSRSQERVVKVFILRNPETTPVELTGDEDVASEFCPDEEEDFDDENLDEDCNDQISEGEKYISKEFQKAINKAEGFSQDHMTYSTMLSYHGYFVAAGSNGLSQTEAANIFRTSKLDTRSLCRSFKRRSFLYSVMEDIGRQRVTKYIAEPFQKSGSLTKEFNDEKQKIISLRDQKEDQVSEIDEGPSTSTVIETDKSDEVQICMEAPDVKQDISRVEDRPVEGLLDAQPNTNKISTSHVTTRVLKRAYHILELINTKLIIDDMMTLQRSILKAEEKEGSQYRIDRKSLNRLLVKLLKEGLVKTWKVNFKNDIADKCVTFLVHPSITKDHPLLMGAIEQNRQKFLVKTMGKDPGIKPEVENPSPKPSVDPSVEASVEELRLMHDKKNAKTDDKSNLKIFIEKRIGETLGRRVSTLLGSLQYHLYPSRNKDVVWMIEKFINAPYFPSIETTLSFLEEANLVKSYVGSKFIRLRELHYLFFYLVYDYQGNAKLNQEQAWLDIKQQTSVDDDVSLFPRIYLDVLCWKMFIPPLPEHPQNGKPGWTFLVDILLRLPLCLFVRLVNVSLLEDLLRTFLDHPIKQYLLVKNLPVYVRTAIFQGRRYVSSLKELVNKLCCMGLVQYGQQIMKEKDQVFIYINRNAVTVDTTTSEPGYVEISDKQYVRTHHNFESFDEVEEYWMILEKICLHTQLGDQMHAVGRNIHLTKLERLPCLEPQSPEEASRRDVGYIPGDGRGAGGLDSAMYGHLRRNWYWKSKFLSRGNLYNKEPGTFRVVEKESLPGPLKKVQVMKVKKPRLSIYKPSPKSNSSEFSLPEKQPEIGDSKKSQHFKTKDKRNDMVVRKFVKKRKCQERRPFYDDQDHEALRRMKKLRVEWSEEEDFFLLLCRVTSLVLLPQRPGQIGFTIVRDALHARLEESRNKTSRACQRRVNYMLKKKAQRDRFRVHAQEVKSDYNIMKDVKTFNTLAKYDTTDKEMISAFHELLDKIYKKFLNKTPKKPVLLPDTYDEFTEHFALADCNKNLQRKSVPKSVHSIVDIDYYAVYGLMFCCFCSAQDKESWGYQRYLAYQNYEPEFLQIVLTDIRQTRMTSYKKQFNRSKVRRKVLPLTTSPYQLSLHFVNLFRQKHTQSLYSLSWVMMKALLDNKRKHCMRLLNMDEEQKCGKRLGKSTYRKKRKLLDKVQLIDTQPLIDLLSSEEEPKWPVSSNPDGGTCAAIIALFSLQRIKMETVIPETIVTLEDSTNSGHKSILKRRLQESLTEQLAPSDYPIQDEDDDVVDANDDSLDDDSVEAKRIPENPQEEATTELKFSNKSSRSRLGIFLMREYLTGQSESPGFADIANDEMTVNACDLSICLQTPPGETARVDKLDDIPSTFLPISPALVKQCLQQCERVILADKLDIVPGSNLERQSKPILEFLDTHKELGATAKMIKDHFKDSFDVPALKLMNELEAFNQVIRVGAITKRWVLPEHSKPWFINNKKVSRQESRNHEIFRIPGVYDLSNKIDANQKKSIEDEEDTKPDIGSTESHRSKRKLSETCDSDSKPEPFVGRIKPKIKKARGLSQKLIQFEKEVIASAESCTYENISVQVKPWVRLNGCLNRRVLDQFLGSILFYIADTPGVRTTDISKRFYPGLIPAHTYELLDVLIRLDCIRRFVVSKMTCKPFRESSSVTKHDVEAYDFDDDLLHEATPDCFIKLGIFIGDKAYEEDFLTACR